MNERVRLIEKLRKGAKINIIGDSISAGVGCSGGYPTEETLLVYGEDRYVRWHAPNSWGAALETYLAEKFPGCKLENHGCSGIYSCHLRGGLDQVVAGDEDIVLILIGANDRKRENGRQELEEALEYFVDLFRSRGAIPVLISPNPSTAQNEVMPSRLCHIEDIVNVINYVALKKDAIYANCYEYILQYMTATGCSIESLMRQDGCMSDGLHPTDRVYALMLDCILSALGLAKKIPTATW